MPLRSYGVLVGRAVDSRREGARDTPHYQVHVVDDSGTSYRIAVNVLSQESPSELLYLVDDTFDHPLVTGVGSLGSGWHPLASEPGGVSLDFIRGNLFDRADMRALPPDAAGPDNDLADLFDHYLHRAIADPTAVLYAFGERWGPEAALRDKIFGFEPGNGVHDIHMNQGNVPRFSGDDGVWQDGGLLLHYPTTSRWVGIFLAFQSQAWQTDDVTGHAIGVPSPAGASAPIRILAALVNPAGPAPEQERVLLLNASSAGIDLTGWSIADRMAQTCPVPDGVLAPGTTLDVAIRPGVRFGNGGGTITLLDASGLKVDGVSYTREQARPEGWTTVF